MICFERQAEQAGGCLRDLVLVYLRRRFYFAPARRIRAYHCQPGFSRAR